MNPLKPPKTYFINKCIDLQLYTSLFISFVTNFIKLLYLDLMVLNYLV